MLRPADALDCDVLNLHRVEGGEDGTKIDANLRKCDRYEGARGGCIRPRYAGVRAAVAAGLDFLVADPAFPPLLAAMQAEETLT